MRDGCLGWIAWIDEVGHEWGWEWGDDRRMGVRMQEMRTYYTHVMRQWRCGAAGSSRCSLIRSVEFGVQKVFYG